MYKNRSKGFTLIELLVVIAIIGILSAVVLASLNTARQKGGDAAIKSNLDTVRTQSAIYYDTNLAYSTANIASDAGSFAACAVASTIFVDPNVSAAIAAADKAAGGNGAATPTKVKCANDGGGTAKISAWAISAPLLQGGFYCVDSTGVASTTAAAVGSTECI